MSQLYVIAALSALLLLAVVIIAVLWRSRRRRVTVLQSLNDEMVSVSADALLGRRLPIPSDPDSARIVHAVNQLFDALGKRDKRIQGRDRLFRDFARTFPEIALIHEKKNLLANESAASLSGLRSNTERINFIR